MEKRKTLSYDWELGQEELIISVDVYSYEKRLYIGLYHMEEDELRFFEDLTVNLPYSTVEMNEAYISNFSSRAKLDFIKRHGLGRVLPEMGRSGYCRYSKVAFNLERLAEFDREGVERYKNGGVEPRNRKIK